MTASPVSFQFPKMPRENKKAPLKAYNVQCPHWTSITLWTIGVLVMVGLTINDLRPIVVDYYDLDENTQVQIRMKSTEEDYERPRIMLDIPLTGDHVIYDFLTALRNHFEFGEACSECEAMANYSFDVWSQWNTSDFAFLNSTEGAHKLVNGFLKRLLEFENTTDIISIDNLSWNRPIIYALASFLSNQTAILEAFTQRFRIDKGWPRIDSFVDVSAEQFLWLYSTMNSFMCQLITIKTDMYTVDAKPVSLERCLTFMREHSKVHRSQDNGPMRFRFTLPLSGTDSLYVSLASAYFDAYLRKQYERIQVLKGGVWTAFGLEPFYFTTDKELEEINFEDVHIIYSPQSSLAEARPSELRSCTKIVHNEARAAQCRLRYVESICNCLSLAVLLDPYPKPMNTTVEHCNRTHYDRCFDRLSNAASDCPKKTSHPCRWLTYQYRVLRNVASRNQSAFRLSVLASDEPYLEFVMKQKDFPESLISQIGGVFNFYLGISGLSIFCFVIYAIDGCRKWRRMVREEKNAKGSDGRVSTTVGYWNWRWLNLLTSRTVKPEVAFDQKLSAMFNENMESMENQVKREMKTEMLKVFERLMEEMEVKLEKARERRTEGTT